MKKKIQTLLAQLNHGLVEREATIKTALLTVLAGENIVLIGPPGTGKSLIARRIAQGFADSSDNSYFEYLLTKFSTPEEIFGPLSITELKADRFRRNTAGYLPTVKMAFLDEIFKANSSILNALLTILNERIYHNGSEPQKVPMRALIAASNELPNDQVELSALYDRFLVRGFVDYVSQDSLPRLFENFGEAPPPTQLTSADLKHIQHAVESVTIPQEIALAIQRIWIQHKEAFKEDLRESLSDRRLKKVIQLLRVSAATNGRSLVDLSDLLLLKDCLWNHPDNAIKVRQLILSTLQTCSYAVQQTSDAQAVGQPSGLLTYEVGQDGKTLIQAQAGTAIQLTAPSSFAQTNAKVGSVVKGFKGSGTAHDPLLIQTVDDLMDLSRPEVGLKGYHFLQTADIDCTALNAWMRITFFGHYDGAGHTVKYKHNGFDADGLVKTSAISTDGGFAKLFGQIHAQSTISHIQLEGLYIAESALATNISHCVSDVGLVTQIAEDCSISACKTGAGLIAGEAINCCVSDCVVIINLLGRGSETVGGIADRLINGCVVERCFVAGLCKYRGHDFFTFYGIARVCNDSTVRQCAIGQLKGSSTDVQLHPLVSNASNTVTLEKNAAIEGNMYSELGASRVPKRIDAMLFKQRYFENTLDWDFDTVWQWDDVLDRPALRPVGIGAASLLAIQAHQGASMTDLLTQQMRANIWL